MTKLIIICIILLVLTSLLFVPVRVVFTFERKERENAAVIKVKYLFFSVNVPVKEETENSKNKSEATEERKTEKSIAYYKKVYNFLKKDLLGILNFLKRKAVNFEKIDITTEFGFSDAAQTGIMTGVFNAFYYNAVAYLHNNFNVKDWNITVTPDFNKEKFGFSLSGILKIKTAHIIIVMFKGLKLLIKKRILDERGSSK